MGLIARVTNALLGGKADAVTEVVEVFRENAEGSAERAGRAKRMAMKQFAAEFASPRRGWFDRFVDGLNRLPRPMMALGTLGLFVSAMTDPIWFASRMQGIALVPEPLWWLLGAIVSFYFGARHQTKGQEFRRSLAETAMRAGLMTGDLRDAAPGPSAPARPASRGAEPNAALAEWRARHG